MSTLFVLGEESREPVELQVDGDVTPAKVASAFSQHNGHEPDSYMVFVEDGDEPLAPEIIIEELPPCFHVHRCRRVAVAVEYNSKTAAGEFSPASTVATVLSWAVKQTVFKIPPGDQPRFGLALEGGDGTPLPDRDHIGQFASQDRCGVSFVLVERSKPQG